MSTMRRVQVFVDNAPEPVFNILFDADKRDVKILATEEYEEDDSMAREVIIQATL